MIKPLLFAALLLILPTLADAVPVTVYAEVTVRPEVTLRELVTEFVPVAELLPPIYVFIFAPYVQPITAWYAPPDADPPVAHTPEPMTLVLMGSGLAWVGWRKWRATEAGR